jgi:energy-coupling factor transporter transmembrane protein EcfT
MGSAIPGLIIGILWLAASIFFIIKINVRKVARIIGASFLFILFAGIFIGTAIGSDIGKKAVQENVVVKMNDYLKENHGNLTIVKSGVTVPDLPKAIDELQSVIVSNITKNLGALTRIFAAPALGKGFNEIKKKIDILAVTADENGKVSTLSILNSLRDRIYSIINNVVLVLRIIVSVLLAIFFVIRLVEFLKTLKKAN